MSSSSTIEKIANARVEQDDPASLWAVHLDGSNITSLDKRSDTDDSHAQLHSDSTFDARGRLVLPALVHAHIHLDKCFLLSDPAYADLSVSEGTFGEAMSLTSTAKARFARPDLLRRGRRLIASSVAAGVTGMRAFVEVDEIVGLECVHAALEMRDEFADRCEIQICAFAQMALFDEPRGGHDVGEQRRRLLVEALRLGEGVGAVGATPYVETDRSRMERNVQWTIQMAIEHGKHLDFHLDYNLDPQVEPLVSFVIDALHQADWVARAAAGRTVCLGHCTRLTLFSATAWQKLREQIRILPVFFVGLPTSDMYMMGRPGPPLSDKTRDIEEDRDGGGTRPRATLQIPHMIKEYDLNGAIGINNVGNAFTPQGGCDPLALATLGVGLYHAGTRKDAELLYSCVATEAARAIGLAPLHPPQAVGLHKGPAGDLVVYGEGRDDAFDPCSVAELVYNPTTSRTVIRNGRVTASNVAADTP